MNDLFQRKILIIEDDESLRTPWREYFSSCGASCCAAPTVREGLRLLENEEFDAVVLEWRLSDCELLFSRNELPPVIACSGEGSEEEVLRAFSLGAADFAVLPCSPRLLAARVALRLLPRRKSFVACGKLSMNLNTRAVLYEDKPIKLTSSEFKILYFLITHPNKFYSADALYTNVWNALSMQTSVVRFHITNLRKTLLSATGKKIILTEFGMGYALSSEECQ